MWRENVVSNETVVDKIVKMAEAEDVPVLGIGPSTDMEGEPPGYRPSDMLAGARSMVCFGIPAPHGVYQASARSTEMIWRSQNLLYRRLDTLSMGLAQVMEACGARAVPVFGCCPMAVDSRGRVVGYVNQLRMGKLTGIGMIGRNGLLLHRRYGARLMLGGVITTLDLPAVRIPGRKPTRLPSRLPYLHRFLSCAGDHR